MCLCSPQMRPTLALPACYDQKYLTMLQKYFKKPNSSLGSFSMRCVQMLNDSLNCGLLTSGECLVLQQTEVDIN